MLHVGGTVLHVHGDYVLHVGGRANGNNGKSEKQSIDAIIVNHFAFSKAMVPGVGVNWPEL